MPLPRQLANCRTNRLMHDSAEQQELGKLIVSAAKSLKDFRLADPRIAGYLYATSAAGKVGLFTSSIRGERRSEFRRIRRLAAEEGIDPYELTTVTLPWLSEAGFCHLERDADGEIQRVSSLLLAYRDLLGAVTEFYFSRNPTDEDRACLQIVAEASRIPTPESQIRQSVATQFSEEVAGVALNLAKSYQLVAAAGQGNDQLLYAPRVWGKLNRSAGQVLAPLGNVEREVLAHLIDLVRGNQGYPESVLRHHAAQQGVLQFVDMLVGIGLLNKTELHMGDGTTQSFLTTTHLYADLSGEFGEDMCDRIKIFLDSIRNGQYFTHPGTGRILDPVRLLNALVNRGEVGPATAIGTDYLVAEKAGIVQVRQESGRALAYMELRQEDVVRKVLEIVSTGITEPGSAKMNVNQMAGGVGFGSIEQSRARLGNRSAEIKEIESEIMKQLRE